ncbi:hypothetical protein T484DRAFT_1793044, partial [Baffinella frigidus]
MCPHVQMQKAWESSEDKIMQKAWESPEDKSVTPWIERPYFRFRYRSYGIFVKRESPEDKSVTPWIEHPYFRFRYRSYGIFVKREPGKEPKCVNCDDWECSQDEDEFQASLAKTPNNVSALVDYGALALPDPGLDPVRVDTDGWEDGDDDEEEEAGEAPEVKMALPGDGIPEDVAPRFSSRVTALHNLGVARALAGDYDEAEALLREAIRLHPRHPSSLVRLGELLQDERGQFDEAQALYERALSANNKHIEALYAYGALLFQVRRNFTAAQPVIELAVRIDPGGVHLQFLYSLFLLQAKRRRDQARDGLHWITHFSEDRNFSDAWALYAEIQHNPKGEMEHRRLKRYSGSDAKKRRALRGKLNQAVPDGDESSEWEKAIGGEDLLKYQPAYAFTDIDKSLVVVKDTLVAGALYRYAQLLQEIWGDLDEASQLYETVLRSDTIHPLHRIQAQIAYGTLLHRGLHRSADAQQVFRDAEKAAAACQAEEDSDQERKAEASGLHSAALVGLGEAMLETDPVEAGNLAARALQGRCAAKDTRFSGNPAAEKRQGEYGPPQGGKTNSTDAEGPAILLAAALLQQNLPHEALQSLRTFLGASPGAPTPDPTRDTLGAHVALASLLLSGASKGSQPHGEDGAWLSSLMGKGKGGRGGGGA